MIPSTRQQNEVSARSTNKDDYSLMEKAAVMKSEYDQLFALTNSPLSNLTSVAALFCAVALSIDCCCCCRLLAAHYSLLFSASEEYCEKLSPRSWSTDQHLAKSVRIQMNRPDRMVLPSLHFTYVTD